MAKFMSKPQFLDENISLMSKRINSQYSTFLEMNPTFTNYYHINTKMSTVDKGTKDIEGLLDNNSPMRYNEIKDFPIYIDSSIQLDLREEDQGLDIEYEGEGIILPNTIYPFQDDYFYISYLGKRFLFRVSHVNYDTVKSNGYYKISFILKATTEKYTEKIEHLVVEKYSCIFENIGTSDKCILRDTDFDLLAKVYDMIDMLTTSYIDKFLDRKYNALMFMRSGNCYLYDYQLNRFVNKSRIFDPGDNSNDVIILYEESRAYSNNEFEQSIFDRVLNSDTSDINDVNIYYDMEPAISTDSIFDYYSDSRVKYLAYYLDETGPYGNKLTSYVPKDFIQSIEYKNIGILNDPYEKFMYTYMRYGALKLIPLLDSINIRRLKYSFHTYIFLPLVIYGLRQLTKAIMFDNSLMDEKLIHENT